MENVYKNKNKKFGSNNDSVGKLTWGEFYNKEFASYFDTKKISDLQKDREYQRLKAICSFCKDITEDRTLFVLKWRSYYAVKDELDIHGISLDDIVENTDYVVWKSIGMFMDMEVLMRIMEKGSKVGIHLIPCYGNDNSVRNLLECDNNKNTTYIVNKIMINRDK